MKAALSTRRKANDGAYPDIDFVPTNQRRSAGPWTRAELDDFKAGLDAPTTQATRRSHCSSISSILKDEYPGKFMTLPDKQILDESAIDLEAVERVAASLAEKGYSSAGNFLSSWNS